MKNLNSLKIQNERKKERKKERKMSATTTTTLQELLQYEEDSFIPDDLDDKFYNDHIYNWEVMFETVKLFLMKKEVAEMWKGRGQARCDYGRWLQLCRGTWQSGCAIKDRINSRGNYLKRGKEVELDSFHVG